MANTDVSKDDMEILREAMIETEKEVFGEAFGQEETTHDETGDKSLEDMGTGLEGQHEDEEEEGEETETEEEGEEGEQPEPPETKVKPEDGKTKPEGDKPTGQVPPGRLRQAGERARAAEAERDALKSERDSLKGQIDKAQADSRKEIDELKNRFDGVLQALQRMQPNAKTDTKEADKPIIPDLFENPQAFVDHFSKGVDQKLGAQTQQLGNMRVELSMQIASAVHGETFDKAFAALKSLNPRDPDAQMTVRRIMASDNPGRAVIDWHKRNETLREVGDDPAKFRERVATETREALMKDPDFRKQLLAELRGEAETGDNGRPRTAVRLPRSLNGAPGNAAHSEGGVGDGSDRAVFDSAFS